MNFICGKIHLYNIFWSLFVYLYRYKETLKLNVLGNSCLTDNLISYWVYQTGLEMRSSPLSLWPRQAEVKTWLRLRSDLKNCLLDQDQSRAPQHYYGQLTEETTCIFVSVL